VTRLSLEMKELILNADGWSSADDLYDAFFRAVGAPSWHGRNFNALNDSIATGSINAIEVPYRLVIQNSGLAGSAAQQAIGAFVDLIREIAARGCPVEIRLEQNG
jgi:RNAse (barnase) inhibitor barstar